MNSSKYSLVHIGSSRNYAFLEDPTQMVQHFRGAEQHSKSKTIAMPVIWKCRIEIIKLTGPARFDQMLSSFRYCMFSSQTLCKLGTPQVMSAETE